MALTLPQTKVSPETPQTNIGKVYNPPTIGGVVGSGFTGGPLGSPEYNVYNPGGVEGFEPTSPEGATEAGLGTAHMLLKKALEKDYLYPKDISGQMIAPTQTGFYDFAQAPQMQQVGVTDWQSPQFGAQFLGMYAPQQVPPSPFAGLQSKLQPGMTPPGTALPPNLGDVAKTGYEQVTVPDAQQMMGGDYQALEAALAQPGQIAAERAFQEGGVDIKNVMGGRGLYGSSMMGNQMVDLSKQYMDTLATNAAQAAAQRYGMQQQDLQALNQYELAKSGMNVQQQQFLTEYEQAIATGNVERAQKMALEAGKFGLAQDELNLGAAKVQADFNIKQAGVQQDISKEQWGAGLMDTQRYQEYMAGALQHGMTQEEAQRGFYNQQIQDQFNYQMSQQNWQQQINEMLSNQALALAGQGAPLASAALTAQASEKAAAEKAKATETAALYAGIGGVTGSIAGSIDWGDIDWPW